MSGRTGSSRTEFRAVRRAMAMVAIPVAVIAAGCSSDRIVTTDEPRPTMPSNTEPPPPLPAPPNNDRLANAFDFATGQDAGTVYHFSSPSKRWVCAVVPRQTAGCQAATGATIPIAGAPDSVPGPQGIDAPPNAIEVGPDTDAQFAALDAPGFAPVPGPAAILPFGKVLMVAGFRCNVQEATGISCASETSGKGFTFSADGFTPQYTDLPA